MFCKKKSYHNSQKNVFCPCLEAVWEDHVDNFIPALPSEVILCGDGCCDSPNHSAKLLAYPLMEHHKGRIVQLEFVDKWEVNFEMDLKLSRLLL